MESEQVTIPSLEVTKTYMNNKNFIITGSIIGLLLIISLFAHSYSAPVKASSPYPAKAEQLGAWIDEQSSAYDAADRQVTTLTTQIAEAQKQLALAAATRDKAAEIAKGYRYALCTEFQLQRTFNVGNGVFLPAQESQCASFQSGELPAL